MLQLLVVEDRLQVAECVFAVLWLVAGFGVFNQNFLFLASVWVFVLIASAHTRFHLIHILTTCTTASEGVPSEACRVDFNLDGIVDERSHKH